MYLAGMAPRISFGVLDRLYIKYATSSSGALVVSIFVAIK
jgi:hypothetical protein